MNHRDKLIEIMERLEKETLEGVEKTRDLIKRNHKMMMKTKLDEYFPESFKQEMFELYEGQKEVLEMKIKTNMECMKKVRQFFEKELKEMCNE